MPTKQWRDLRKACLVRDGYRCIVCGERAVVVDHIVSRKAGGQDTLSNLRSLCRQHDNQCKEDAQGKRRSGNQFRGCDVYGNPLDPLHKWYGR